MSSSKSWDLQVDPNIFRILKRIPRHDAGVILDVIKLLPVDPYFGDIQKMRGEDNSWRRRIGSYRVFYKIKIVERIVLVFRLERRSSKTY